MRSDWSPILYNIMNTLDSSGRKDLSDEIEKRIASHPSSSEIMGETGAFLIQLKKTEPDVFEKIRNDYYSYFKDLNSKDLFIGMDV